MARKIGLKNVDEKVDNILPKYNYGNGFGWCVKRDKKRAKRSATGKSILGRRK